MADSPGATGSQRFVVTNKFQDPSMQQFANELLDKINEQKFPISVGPGEAMPVGIQPGQIVVTWTPTGSTFKVWTGDQYV